ncbi:hypothetical protein AC792_08005 [Arthrobacter sp. RIT-PI-e]|nr:hypothetical protein AC792_08005 [Arthrobacter sp. RIT-PI-e]
MQTLIESEYLMAEPRRTNYVLRSAFLLPGLVIIVIIANVARDPSDNFTPPAVLIPGVVFIVLSSLILTEYLMKRKRRHLQSE